VRDGLGLRAKAEHLEISPQVAGVGGVVSSEKAW
jgi:hypothetical protein